MDKKLNGRTYFVEESDDIGAGRLVARYYGLCAYGQTVDSAVRACDKLVQEEQDMPEDC